MPAMEDMQKDVQLAPMTCRRLQGLPPRHLRLSNDGGRHAADGNNDGDNEDDYDDDDDDESRRRR